MDNEVAKLRNRIESILESIYSLDSSSPSLPLPQTQGNSSDTTTVDIFVDTSNTDLNQLHGLLFSLSQDLLSLELHFLSLSNPSDPVPWNSSPLSDRVDALHSALSSLYEKTAVISSSMQVVIERATNPQRVTQIFHTIFAESHTTLDKMNKAVLDVRKVYERVAEVEPLLQIAPLLKARLDHFVETSKKVSQVQSRLDELVQKQELLEKRVEKTGEILNRVGTSLRFHVGSKANGARHSQTSSCIKLCRLKGLL